MKRIWLFFVFLGFLPVCISGQTVSLRNLLAEMADPGQLARYPDPEYRSLQSSSYNRESISPQLPGWFADSDGVSWIRAENNHGEVEYVVMEHQGPGCITRMWTPFFYYDLNNRKGPNVKIYLDGSGIPVIDECFIDLLTGKGSFRNPFAILTARAGVSYLPIPFEKSCKITLTGKPFYHIINYRAYEENTPVRSFSLKQYTQSKNLLDRTAKKLISPTSPETEPFYSKAILLDKVESIELPSGENAINQLTIRLEPGSDVNHLRSTFLQISFDGQQTVWCPVGDFFCSPDKINPFQTGSRIVTQDGTMICRYVMPYRQQAQLSLINLGDSPVKVHLQIQVSRLEWTSNSMHFFSSWNPIGSIRGDQFRDLNFIDVKGKGVLVGDALTVLSPGTGWWGEGDEKIYINQTDIDRNFPSHFGTGTEDYYGWAGGLVPTGRDTFSIPIGANVCNGNKDNPRGYNICTRNRILDAIPFNDRLRFDMEASPGTDIRESWNLLNYSLVTFWYAVPGTISNACVDSIEAAKPLTTLKELDQTQEFLKSGILDLSAKMPVVPLELKASPGQFLVFPLKLKAHHVNCNNIGVNFQSELPSSRFTCFNLGGLGPDGKKFARKIDLMAGTTKEFWMGLDLLDVPAGIFRGNLVITSDVGTQILPVEIKISGTPLPEQGYGTGNSMARLNWLNSSVGIDDHITKEFLPVKVIGRRFHILGRTLEVADNGLPSAITTFFEGSNQGLNERGEPVINKAFRFIIEKSDGSLVRLKPGFLEINEVDSSRVTWRVVSSSDEFTLECLGTLEFDGFVDYRLKLNPKKKVSIRDIRLEIPVAREKAEYMMGLNHEGGLRPESWSWKWNVSRNQDMLWIGSVNGGFRIKWKDQNYKRPLINIYYSFGPLNLPTSWCNAGKGGVTVQEGEKDVLVKAFSGARSLDVADTLNYNFELLLTPFHPINREVMFGDRYYHGGGTKTSVKIEDARNAGANMINIHHAEDLYPFINYPYLDENVEELKLLTDKAHSENLRLKLYYTTREITKNLPEFRAFYSLDGEVIFPGPGDSSKTLINPNGPDDWLRKNLQGAYIPAWHNLVPEGKFKGETDLSVITTPDSRLNNFYIAGLDWMVRNLKIDGVYIDDSALDRFTLMRARKIIDKYRPAGRIDLHSWNHFNEWAGYTNCLNLYMDLLPFVDQVWIGEGRDYNRAPDHWLIEVSGIPFGVPGQMLEGGGNPWRGMVYGISNRAGWTANPPGPLWAFWDLVDMKGKKMIGYWDKSCPVSTISPSVKATLFKGKDISVIAVANWTSRPLTAGLKIDWEKLGLDPEKTDISIPAITDFQMPRSGIDPFSIIIPAGKGYLLVLSTKSRL